MKVKFKEAGRWAEPNDSSAPQFEVKAGEVKEVSDDLGSYAVAHDKAEIVNDAPPKVDKFRAEGNPAKKDKSRAKRR